MAGMALLETPSRIWRRIQAVEGADMPSLPSLPHFDDDEEEGDNSGSQRSLRLSDPSQSVQHGLDRSFGQESLPLTSTPAAFSHHTVASTILAPSSTSSAARFAASLVSRSTSGKLAISGTSTKISHKKDYPSFDASGIPQLPDGQYDGFEPEAFSDEESSVDIPSVPRRSRGEGIVDDYGENNALSLMDALGSVSRTSSPYPPDEGPLDEGPSKRKYDYSISLRSEPKPSPLDKYRNVAQRKAIPRTRTPSLSRTMSSPSSSSANSTPQSTRSVPLPAISPAQSLGVNLPRSRTTSPTALPLEEESAEDDLPSVGDLSIPQPEMEETISPHRLPEAELTTIEEESPSQTQSREVEEPTFSTDEGNTTTNRQIPGGRSTAFSSPAHGSVFTPTPVLKARFTGIPSSPQQTPSIRVPSDMETPRQQSRSNGGSGGVNFEDEPLVTPATRRRSFLLDVINSTTRPRIRATPHPRKHYQQDQTADTTAEPGNRTPGSASILPTPKPRPKPRMSHPLAQTSVHPSEASESEEGGGGADPLLHQPRPRARARHSLVPTSSRVSASASQYDSDRASFVSTASSHDLTAHPRANASFDPVMMGAGGGHGVGRFNANKLNAYLHGLNRRLQEENEALLERVRMLSGSSPSGAVCVCGGATANATADQISLAGDRSMVKGVRRQETTQEKEVLVEGTIAQLRSEMERLDAEKAEIQRSLAAERGERSRDREMWKDRMSEVEKGVAEIVRDLEEKAAHAEHEKIQAERRAVETEEEKGTAMMRAARAEAMLDAGAELGGELKATRERVDKVMGDLKNANKQIRELEDEVMRSDGRVDQLEQQLKEVNGREERASKKTEELQKQLASAEHAVRTAHEEHRTTKKYVTELEEDAGAAVERIEDIEEQLAAAQQTIEQMDLAAGQSDLKAEGLERDARRASERVRLLEDALSTANGQIGQYEEELVQLRSKIASSPDRERSMSSIRRDRSRSRIAAGPTDADVEMLEEELDNATKEIARLTSLLHQSPARKAIDKAKDTKIEMLEKEKEDLQEMIKILRSTVKEMGTPNKFTTHLGISPAHTQIFSAAIRTPKTPGGPIRDLSWLSGGGDPTVPPLVHEISRLQRELDRANGSIDDKLDRLEEAGLGVVGLTRKLEDARCRIVGLEEEIARLSRREDRRVRRLARARCQKCHIKLDFDGLNDDESSANLRSPDLLPTEPPTPPTKTSEALRANVQTLNAHLDSLKAHSLEEKGRLETEKAALQDTAKRLNLQVRSAKDEARQAAEIGKASEKRRSGLEDDLDQAKKLIAELEADLADERSQLRGLMVEQTKVEREQEDVLLQLRRMETDMDDVKEELQGLKRENHNLEGELRANANADQKARLLEVKVAANSDTIDQLREERSILVKDYKELQRRFTDLSEHANRLRSEHAMSQTSHDNRRHQIDLYLGEIDELRLALSEQASELQRAEDQKALVEAENNDVNQAVATLEADLKRVKRDAEAFGRELRQLRVEKGKVEERRREEGLAAERAMKQAQAQIRVLKEQLEAQKDRARIAEERERAGSIDQRQLTAIKLRHNKECKGLIVQIRYLKAKFTRESNRLCMVVAQKDYLMVLLTRFENSERNILTSIAQIGFPLPLPRPPRTRSLRGVALSILFVLHARRASDMWRAQCASKEGIAAALQEVRRNRVAAVAS